MNCKSVELIIKIVLLYPNFYFVEDILVPCPELEKRYAHGVYLTIDSILRIMSKVLRDLGKLKSQSCANLMTSMLDVIEICNGLN